MSKEKEPLALIPDALYRPEEWPRFTGLAITATYDLIRQGRLARPVRQQGTEGRAIGLFGRDFLAYHELLRREREAEMQREAEAAASQAADERNERELAQATTVTKKLQPAPVPASKPKASPKVLEAMARARAARGKTEAGAKS